MSYIGRTPTPAALTASDITDGIVSNAKLAQDIISADTALGATPADTDEFLVSDAGTLKRMDYSYIKSTNTPAFEASMSATQTPTDATWTKLTYNTETFDTAGAYDNSSNYRFTPQTAGKYFCYSQVTFDAQGVDIFHRAYSGIYFNGSIYKQSQFDNYDNYFLYATTNTISAVITFNGSSDYIESYCYFDVTSGTSHRISSGNSSIFGAFKLIE